ncbi:MAG: helix-turn-helix transcriptional regulator [Alphaproteobacteria bacterium]
MQQVVWEMVGQTEFALNVGYGRMKVDLLPNGLSLYRSHIEITEPIELVIHGDDKNQFIGTQFFLMGNGEMELSNGDTQHCTPDHAILLRADQSPTKIRFLQPQILRHIGVSKLVANYNADFQGRTGGVPAPFSRSDQTVNTIQRTTASTELRGLAATLSRFKTETATDEMALYGQSLLFFSTVLRAFELTPPTLASELESWEIDAIQAVKEKFDFNPKHTIDLAGLSSGAGMTPTRFEKTFRAHTGNSVPEYVQNLRLNAAQNLLLTSNTLVKEIAHEFGYGHVSNFSRAYQKFFGESPTETRHRNLS